MKNKKGTYFLLASVALIWGAVIFRFMDFSGDNVYVSTPDIKPYVPEEIAPDTFSLMLNYRDPFLDKKKVTYFSSTPAREQGQKKKPVPNVIPKADVSKKNQEIVFLGLIKNLKTDKTVTLISVNGKIKLMNSGDALNDIRLIKSYPDSVQLEVSGEKLFFVKKF